MKRTRPNDPWRCSVKLRFEHDSGVDDIGQTRTIPFGDEITNPHDVEARIRQAQLAILNPSQSPEDYLYANQEGPSELTFSRDFITVEVFGPNVFDLSFYDLPGKHEKYIQIRVLVSNALSRMDRKCEGWAL